ncbi:MAG: NYN domain-containing protein [Clostridia bacterium]|nr:NYN domain-containing protein [Clostridia bacterium]MDE7328855.1 NYN domain-containing protein [Clostridia bacterium]
MEKETYKDEYNKVAVFVDAENVSYKNAKRIIDVLESKGKILIREIVADWTKINGAQKDKKENLTGWRGVAATYSMTAIQQFTYVPKKNSSDIALAIRAMKTLYEKQYIDTYCIISNDSDFTRLAQELREQDKYVIGMGEKSKAIEEFVKAFSEYIYLDEIIEEPNNASDEDVSVENKSNEQVAIVQEPVLVEKTSEENASEEERANADNTIIGLEKMDALIEIIQELVDEKGMALYCAINGPMKNKYPDFVPQNFGCKNFRKLMEILLPLPHLSELFEQTQTDDDYALIARKTK